MRNLLVFSLVALCAVLVSSETAMAGGGGNGGGNGGKGGGKDTAKASITFTNVDQFSAVRVYLRAPGEELPNVIEALLAKSVLLNANGGTHTTAKLKAGTYQAYAVDAALLVGVPPNSPIDPAFYPVPTPIVVAGVDKTADVDVTGVFNVN